MSDVGQGVYRQHSILRVRQRTLRFVGAGTTAKGGGE